MSLLRLVADPLRIALAAEYDSPEALIAAASTLRRKGYRRLDAYLPFELEALDEVLGIRRSRLPRVCLIAGALGALAGYLVQWYCNTLDYPIDVGGRPLHPVPAFVPITFEMMVLFGGVATFVAFFAGSRLPEPWNPLFELPGFERASVDRYWLGVDERDPRYERRATRIDLLSTGALRVHEPSLEGER